MRYHLFLSQEPDLNLQCRIPLKSNYAVAILFSEKFLQRLKSTAQQFIELDFKRKVKKLFFILQQRRNIGLFHTGVILYLFSFNFCQHNNFIQRRLKNFLIVLKSQFNFI